MLTNFEQYPFERFRELIKDIEPNKDLTPINLTIGEPKFDTPSIITDEVIAKINTFKQYPKTAGVDELSAAQIEFVEKRFGVKLTEEELIPTLGTREVLFNFPQFFLFGKENPVIAFTNPFYQIYEGAAKASKAEIIHLNLKEENGFKPEVNEEELQKADLVIINFPNNPTGSTLTIKELEEWVTLSLKYDFVLLNDECYSEIYENEKPHSLLEASINVGNESFKNILVVNSISKRSSAPGLRSGFIAGDKEILKPYLLYRTYAGATAGVPLQYAAAKAWSDMEHAEEIREQYSKNLKLAREILNVPVFDTTFYVWLKVKDDLKVARELLKEHGVYVLPGTFLSRNGAGQGFIRIALVEKEEVLKDALNRIKRYLAK